MDGRKAIYITGFFPGLKGEPWISVRGFPWDPRAFRGATVYALDRPENPVQQYVNWGAETRTDDSRTLAVESVHRGAPTSPSDRSPGGRNNGLCGVWLIDPAKNAELVLLHNPADSKRPAEGQPRWEVPETLARPAVGPFPFYSAITHGDALWILRWTMVPAPIPGGSTDLELFGFRPGHKTAVRIPLKLTASPEDLDALQPVDEKARIESLTMMPLWKDSLIANSHGLAIAGPEFKGLWIIPWADLNRWIGRN